MISIRKFGGADEYDLLLVTQELAAPCEQWYERERPKDEPPQMTGGEDYPVPDPPYVPDPRIGQLFFPVMGARRWARGDYLISKTTLDLLRADLQYDNRVTLSLRDLPDPSAEVAREFDLYLLSARPLVENNGSAGPAVDAWVVTVVDKRYYWQFHQGATDSNPKDWSSWTDLIGTLITRLGSSPDFPDGVDTDYFSPDALRWNDLATRGVSTPHLLDAAANFVGSRIVVGPDGAVQLQRPAGANRGLVTDFHAEQVAAGRHVGGGLIPATEAANAVPASVDVVFYDPLPPFAPTVVNRTLMAAGAGGYGSAGGVSGSAAFAWADVPADTLAGDPVNWANQYAHDFYDWQLVPLDAQYAGFTTVPVSGFVSHLIYVHSADEGCTWVHRPAENYGGVVRGRNLIDETGGGAAGDELLVEVTAYSGGTRSHTVKRKTWLGGIGGNVADYSPLTTFINCRNPARTTAIGPEFGLPLGTLCWMTAIPDAAGSYWIEPVDDYATDTTPGVMSTFAQYFLGRKRFRSRTEIAYDALTSGYVGTPAPDMEVGSGTVFQVTKAITVLDCGTRTTGDVFVGPGHPLSTSLPVPANIFGFGQRGLRCDGVVLTQRACGYQANLGTLVSNAACFQDVGVQNPGTGGGIPPSTGVTKRPGISFATPGAIDSSYNAGLVYVPIVSEHPLYTYHNPGATYPNGQHLLTLGVSRFGAPGFSISAFGGPLYNPDGSSAGNGGDARNVILGGTQLVSLYAATDGGGGVIAAEFIGGLYIRLVRVGGTVIIDPDPDGNEPGFAPVSVGAGPTTLRAGRTYYADSTSGRSQFFLPLVSSAGDKFKVVGRATGGWQINQRAGQTIRTAGATTTTGVAGTIQGPQWAVLEFECLNDGFDFVISGGNTTVVNGPALPSLAWT